MDYIAVARLMYSWVAFSLIFSTAIEKDMNTFIGHFKSTFMTRRLSDALASGEEVCEGFARMFYALLNGATGTSYAKKISGCTRQLGGLQNPHASMILDHMWNAFPTDAEAMGRGAPGVKYKIIDPTWAIPVVVKDTNGVELPKTRPSSRSVEWSLTNAGQAVFHGPMSEALIAGVRDLVHPTWLAEYLYTDPQTLPYKNLYDMYWKTQPIWYNKDELYWIDTATVTPFNTRMTWLKDASFVVTFKNNCVHQRLNMPDTFLGYFNTDWATVKSIANKTSNILPQPKVEWQRFAPNAMDPGDTRIIWSAKLTLAPDATTFTSGTVVLAGYFDGPDLERQQEDFDPRAEGRYRPIIVWDVVVE
ncbi:hypothetical protein BDY17DRAFT_302483 [Neohortaea acidophila]|uniref:Uncharacterized protein n=1 Tax=Neohortaea acidophila TaxID=245834 RepID=A0A6A6PL82_9PEZI|nr:uncharacterized protein BDY17DRAFT_302483 [Neohortaea acidophila]KAF2480838.1 hypothetical protein BDY17DRAFT_302483 [Neohortaea acidophila]